MVGGQRCAWAAAAEVSRGQQGRAGKFKSARACLPAAPTVGPASMLYRDVSEVSRYRQQLCVGVIP